jgi:hypothetical protein
MTTICWGDIEPDSSMMSFCSIVFAIPGGPEMEFLQKPFEFRQLLEKVRQALER